LRRITLVAIGKDGAVVRHLRTLFGVGAIRELTDGQLLERFAAGPSEAAEPAFAVLLERHGPMVLRVCRSVLADAHEHDAQDAFQATFLVLVEKARGLWVRDSLGPWLHQVAFRTAACARTAAARRRRHERRAAAVAVEAREMPSEPDRELDRVLHEELERLPERYRAPLVLCDLQGLSHEQAARSLGWPVGTVKSRLARGRHRLRGRLVRRGLAPDAGLLTALLKPAGPDALVPAALVDSTAGTAIPFLTARTIAPASVLFLAQGVLRSMLLIRWLKVASVVLVLGATASGLDLLARKGRSAAETETGARTNLEAPPGADRPGATMAVRPGKFSITVAGRGLVEASESQDVYSQVEGRTTIISILPEGTSVKKGQLVGELDSSVLQDRLRNQRIATLASQALHQSAQRNREVAQIAVSAYVEGSYKQELETVLGEITAARSAIPNAETRLARTRRASERLNHLLSAKGEAATAAEIVAGLDLEDRIDVAEQTLLRDRMALERAMASRHVLEIYTRDKTVKELQIVAENAKSNELAKQQTWELEKDKEARLEKQIHNCKLLAPGDGILVYANDPSRFGSGSQPQIEEGAAVQERQRIFSVPNIHRPMRVNVKVPEAWVDRVRPAQPVRIRVDAFAEEALTGTVNDVAPLPDARRSIDPPDDKRKFYTTHVTLDKGLSGLRPGMSAQAEILIAELENVLTVPVAALLLIDGKYHVAVKKPEGGFDLRTVTLGMASDERVEVKQGLQSGDVVVPDPLSLMSDEEKRARKIGAR
jgi:RNA polymerase sigma factor (sigma-70 family)